ncbi:chromosome segregation protein SMC [Sphingomonas panacisoli]|uniref:Chromosome partition protein Smc n=1 Tax=Sphingomonas panacisoli TaxID=1813879 RepID=A0A5B8LNY2_9SPHN|nr:chromosome segregation protein SMC [Sphingomonas panacisoli]QDZ08810.1 chromosome segregation protein SMC [Sphingomonas panacisoli]
MQIKRLRLSGFKSFVDAADLRIEPGLTGVVGPNGCGKSNLLEALRWTMGENSPKSMRGAGMDDVIFAGTDARPARDFAEVSILAEIDGGETEVVRRIERGAGSAYRIDGRDVRAKDVALLFADAATGAHSPALVSQGRIGAVIAAKPAERRAMLEEAAGIAGLHVRRKDAEQKLRATEANLARLDEIMSDQEARANALRRQARQAERYRELSDKIRVAEGRMIFARWRDAAAAADAAKAEAGQCEEKVATAAEMQRAAAAHQHAATQALAEARAGSQAAREAATEAGHALAGLRAEHAAAERRIVELAEQRGRIAEDREREGALAVDAAEAIARLDAETKALTKRADEAAARLPALDATLAEAERAARDADVALAQAMSRQAAEIADARVAEAAASAARARHDRALRDQAAWEAELKSLGDAAPLRAEKAAAAKARADALDSAETARTARARADADERAAQEARDTAEQARAAARAELAAIESELVALEKATRPSGRDRLLDHVRAAPGYERALAAALGDDLETGLDASAERYWSGAEPQAGDPGAHGLTRLGDHVEAPAALARRLAQVLVADSDGGQPLAVGQRLVTLGGVLRRWDGYVARSGGAAAAERLERINRLAALEKARPKAQGSLDKANGQLDAAEAKIAAARADASAARASLERAENAAREATRMEDRATGQLERIEAQRADLDTRGRRVAAEIGEAEAEAKRADAARAVLPDGAATRDAVARLQAEAEARRMASSTAQAERATVDRAIAADRERLAAADAEQKGWRARAGEAAKRIADMAKREATLAAEADAATAKPGDLAAQIATRDAGYADLRTAASSAADAERDAEIKLRHTEETAQAAAEALSLAREARAGAAARAENQDLRRIEMTRLSGERFACPPPLLGERIGFDIDRVGDPQDESVQHDKLLVDRERIGPVNLVAETELAELDTARLDAAAERDELGQAVNQLRGSIGTLNREGRQRLLAAFEAVNGHFQRLFATLFNGGAARLELVDSDDPLEAGLEIMAQPPGKKLQSLTLLSGGEQALTAVALIFGLFLTNPAPICVLDEVDAPLDDANIERFCDLLDRMCRETKTRYLIVTHNAVTMSRMHRLFGVTMVERGVSRLVSVDLGGAETLLAAE